MNNKKIAKIKLLDEINIAVTGLHQEELKLLSDKFAVYAKSYNFHPLFKLRKWDGKIRFFTQSGASYYNLLDEIVPELKSMGYKVEYIDKRKYYDVDIPMIDEKYLEDWGITLGPHQVNAVNAIAKHGNGMIIAGTGAGKALCVNAKVLTPNGWVRNGDLNVGDVVKTPCNENAEILGIYPQGLTNSYRLRFDDGVTIDACENHLWNVWLHEDDLNVITEHDCPIQEFTLKTSELIEYSETLKKLGIQKPISIKSCLPLEYGHDSIFVDNPYAVGKSIGSLTSIPECYKNATLKSRIDFVQGMLDSSYCVRDEAGTISLKTPHEDLVHDVLEITRSIGMISRVDSEYVDGYTVYSATCMAADKCGYKNILDIEPIGEIETQCIFINHPSNLYVTDGFTATHNTFITAVLCDLYTRICKFKVCVIVPNLDLVDQTALELRSVDLKVGTYSGTSKSLEENIIVSTWQSLQHNPKIMSQFQVVLVDEAHGTTGKVLQEILNTHGAHIPVRIGMTGTLPKDKVDRMAIKVCLGNVLFEVKATELIKKGWLSGLHIKMYCLKENFTEKWLTFQKEKPDEAAKLTEKTFIEGFLPDYDAETAYLKKQHKRNTFIADFVENIRSQEKGNTFILVKSVPYGKALSKLIEGSVFVYGQDKTTVRKKIYSMFEENDGIVVISTFQLASTGLNIKRIFNLVFVDAGKSFTKIIQAIGRGLRKAKDKDFVNVYDFYANLKYSKRHASTRKSFYVEQGYDHTVKNIAYEEYYKDDES